MRIRFGKRIIRINSEDPDMRTVNSSGPIFDDLDAFPS
jgi:hypothetical protein